MIKLKDKLLQWAYVSFYRTVYFIYDRAVVLSCVLLAVALGAILTWGVL
jgi:hypothetical protein